MPGELCEHCTKIKRRIDAVKFGSADQAVEGGSPSAARIGAHEEIVLAPQDNSAQGAFRCAVVYLKPSVVDIACQSPPVRERVSHGCCRLALGRERTKHALHPAAQLLQQWPRARLAFSAANFRRLSTDLCLDSIERSDASECLGGGGRSMHHVDVVELAPAVSPTGHLVDSAIAIEMMKSCVRIGLQRTVKAVQMLPRSKRTGFPSGVGLRSGLSMALWISQKKQESNGVFVAIGPLPRSGGL